MTGILTTALTGFFLLSSTTGALSGVGTLQVPTTPEPEPVLVATETYSVSMTGYNAVPEQTDSDPFTTASGAYSNPDIVAAVSRDLRYGNLPFGTVIALTYDGESNNCGFKKVEHLIGYRVIADQMNPRFEKKIDILFDQNDTVMTAVNGQTAKPTNPARALGMCHGVTAHVVGKIDIKNMPTTQVELKMMVGKSALTANK